MPTKDEILNFLRELKRSLKALEFTKSGYSAATPKAERISPRSLKFQPIYLMRRRQHAGQQAVNDKTKYR